MNDSASFVPEEKTAEVPAVRPHACPVCGESMSAICQSCGYNGRPGSGTSSGMPNGVRTNAAWKKFTADEAPEPEKSHWPLWIIFGYTVLLVLTIFLLLTLNTWRDISRQQLRSNERIHLNEIQQGTGLAP